MVAKPRARCARIVKGHVKDYTERRSVRWELREERGGEAGEGAQRLDFGDYKTLVSVVISTVNNTGEVQRKRILFSPDFLDPCASVTSRFRHSLGLGLSPLSLSYFKFQAPLGPNSSQVPRYIHECRDIAHSTNAWSWFVVQT